MKISNSRLIEYFGIDDTEKILDADNIIIDLNIIEVEDFEELEKIINIVKPTKGITLIPAFQKNKKINEFADFFSNGENPLIERTELYTPTSKNIEDVSEETLEKFLHVISGTGVLDKDLKNFVNMQGLEYLSVGQNISSRALSFLAMSTDQLDIKNDNVYKKFSKRLIDEYYVYDTCLGFKESKQIINFKKINRKIKEENKKNIKIPVATKYEIEELVDKNIEGINIDSIYIRQGRDNTVLFSDEFLNYINAYKIENIIIGDNRKKSEKKYSVKDLYKKANGIPRLE